MPYTFPNQRVITVHREPVKSDFLGIKNSNWQYAARDLGAHALMLYLYLASNADKYNLALSPTAIRQTIGMARSTYHDQFMKLIDKGYLVQNSGNGYDFFETPKPRHEIQQNPLPSAVLDSDKCTSNDNCINSDVQSVLPYNTEINNNLSLTNKDSINING